MLSMQMQNLMWDTISGKAGKEVQNVLVQGKVRGVNVKPS